MTVSGSQRQALNLHLDACRARRWPKSGCLSRARPAPYTRRDRKIGPTGPTYVTTTGRVAAARLPAGVGASSRVVAQGAHDALASPPTHGNPRPVAEDELRLAVTVRAEL